MAITAELDTVAREKTGGDTVVAYVKIYKDGVLVENACLRYDPADDKSFREEIGKRILDAENSIEVIKASAAIALDDVVKKKNKEIDEAKTISGTEVEK
jgi:NTP pyrophosphatase (non-canonical NTP hydrolase)